MILVKENGVQNTTMRRLEVIKLVKNGSRAVRDGVMLQNLTEYKTGFLAKRPR